MRPAGAGGVHQLGVDVQQFVGIVAAVAQHLALRVVAEIGDEHLVELQVGAARLAEGAHRLAVGLPEVGEERLHVGIDRFLDRLPAAAEMQRGRRGDRHLRHRRRHRLEEPEMLDHRMAGEVDPPVDVQSLGLGLGPFELQALRHADQLDAVEVFEEIVVPPRAAELAIGRELQSAFLLLGDYLPDLRILNRLEMIGADFTVLAFRACVLDRRRTQEAADMVGAEWRLGALHGVHPPIFDGRVVSSQ